LHCIEQESNFMYAFDTAQRLLDRRFLSPAWKLKRLLKIGSEAEFARAMKTVDDFAHQVIQQRKQLGEEDLNRLTDLLSFFMQLRDERNGQLFNDKFLRDIIISFVAAGRDTTAVTLSWIFYNLSQNPKFEAKAAAEARFVLGADGMSTYSNVQQLEYCHCVFLETLRLFPPVPKEGKYVLKECVLPSGERLPAGSYLNPHFYAQGRMTDVWGPTAKQFDPDRFIGQNDPDPYKLPAFLAGPRMCLGKHMAILEVKMMMSMILHKFKFELVEGQTIETENSITLLPRYPMLMKVFPRP